MRRNQLFTTFQNDRENITFSGFLLYAFSTLIVFVLNCRIYDPQYHPYILRITLSITILAGISGLAGLMTVRFIIHDISGCHFPLRRIFGILGYLAGAAWAAYHWEKILLCLEDSRTGFLDSILGKDIAFYLFDLPFYKTLFMMVFCLVAVSLMSLFIKLFFQRDKDYRKQMDCRGRIFHNRYDWIYVHIGLLMFLLAWGRHLERCDQFYWQKPDLNMDGAQNLVLLPSAGQVFVAVITGSFFLIFPFIRSRLPILSVLHKLSGHRQANPHFCLIRYVLAAAMLMLWYTTPQTCQPSVVQASAAGLHLPFSEVKQSGPGEDRRCSNEIADIPMLFSGRGSEQGQDSLKATR